MAKCVYMYLRNYNVTGINYLKLKTKKLSKD